jgi:hypothetical protein
VPHDLAEGEFECAEPRSRWTARPTLAVPFYSPRWRVQVQEDRLPIDFMSVESSFNALEPTFGKIVWHNSKMIIPLLTVAYFRSQQHQELGEPGRVRGPGRCRNEISLRVGGVHGNVLESAARCGYFGADRRIAATGPAFQHTRRGQNLEAMTNRGYGLICLEEMAADVQDLTVQSEIFRRAATR